MNEGIYEELITQLVNRKIESLDKENYYLKEELIDKAEASLILSQHLTSSFKQVLNLIKADKEENIIEKQILVANKIINFLKSELKNEEFDDNLINTEGKILKALFKKTNAYFSNLDLHLNEITPYTRLTHSELFTGGSVGISLESELRKEILSSNRIDLLVSFIKFNGIRILEKELREFTNRGGKLRIITTTYIGATDFKAIQLLSNLDNTEIKISYNIANERLHAKAYLFYRNTGFHTGYIGSSNFSRTALTSGLEWNLKITTKEVSHIIDKFQKTFESYWNNRDFELYDESQSEKLKIALNQGKYSLTNNINTSFFEIEPRVYQKEILEKLDVERKIHKRFRNLVVAATGTGKTVISAFDYKRFKQENKSSKLLYLVHNKEILKKSLSTFQGILRDNNFGEMWIANNPVNYEYVFASVQTLNNRIDSINLRPDFYDFIIIDECHHQPASSYRAILDYFKPKILLGLTATPERMDEKDILVDFCGKIAAEIRLPEALNDKLLCPFQYFGITDSIDLSEVSWSRGKYIASELSDIYTSNDTRVLSIIQNINKYTNDINDVIALGFCIDMAHAKYMAEKFLLAGLKADYLTSEQNENREIVKSQLIKKEINFLFVVNIFNEGIDIPEINTVLFLRPTESLTIFLQQLGRGLRLSDGKDCLTILDFVGNARPEYRFDNKFRALIGKTSTKISDEIEDDFPHLPLGCSIVLEKKAKEIIIQNIKNATSNNRQQIIKKIINFQNISSLELSLKNFSDTYNIPLQTIYKFETWSRFCQIAGKFDYFNNTNEQSISRAILKKWLATKSLSYFEFILKIARINFEINISDYDEIEKTMLLMLHYDVWQSAGGFDTLENSIRKMGENKILVNEIIEVLEILIDDLDFQEIEIDLPYSQPLKLHSRYTRDQILAAFKFSTFDRKSSNIEGVANSSELNTELLFIDLIKSEEKFSPTTMYDDYAINELLFHWQSQNSAGPDTPKGISYINHLDNNKIILLFVREKSLDEYKNRMGYVFIGQGKLKSHYGAKPMSINWELNEPLPNYLWKDAAKMSIG